MIPRKTWHLVGAVDPGRLEQLGADALEAGRQDDHREAGQQPDADDDQEDVVPGLGDQPRDRVAAGRGHHGVERADVAGRART